MSFQNDDPMPNVFAVVLAIWLCTTATAVAQNGKIDLPDANPGTGKYQRAYTKAYVQDFRKWCDQYTRVEDTSEETSREDALIQSTKALTSWGTLDRDRRHTRLFDKYDGAFIAAVGYWNEKMNLGFDSDEIAVVADFIKHIAIVESNLGYGSGFKGPDGWIDTEDVMQVANPRDPAMKAMGGHTQERWYGGDGVAHQFDCDTTSEEVQGEETTQVTNYNISGEESIFYGTHWLLHQLTKGTNGYRAGQKLTRSALLRAARSYNGGGDKKYVAKVRNALEKGKSPSALPTPNGRKAPSAATPSTHWSNLPK